MSTDELLHDPDLDRALRDLLPPMPRSVAWEQHQRDMLMTFIETGDVVRHQMAEVPVDGGSHVQLRAFESARGDRPRTAVLLGIAAAAVLLVVGLVAAPRWRGPEIPPATVATPVPVTTANAPSDELLFPDLFPILPDDHPLADQATAMYGGMTGWGTVEMTQALVAIDDGTRLTDAVLLQAYRSNTVDLWGGLDSATVTAAGIVGTLYTEHGSPAITTFVVDGEPALAVQALDPIAFIEAIGGIPIVAAQVGADGVPTFGVGPLPDRYDVIVQPGQPGEGRAVHASTRVPDGDNGDGVAVWVGRTSPLMAWSIVGDLERIDVNGTVGWKQDRGRGSTVIWQVSDQTWAMIGGAMNVATAVTLAGSVEFVDRAAWEERYDVQLGTYPTREELEMEVTATMAPSLIALEEIGAIPTVVPIGCGSTPPTDETVGAPVVAAAPDDALAVFVDEVVPGLWSHGWIHTWNGDEADPQHRYEYRREDRQLVTVVYVEAVDGGWAATRWLSTPC